ncbi:hypothetical protein COCC4DRAFT_123581 [Bipolaris maydis ATCC 48331]|uniref:Uncharacterized protein n=2 Tax=Cochliobolus heterostrophus TaxID=5016 RepID=M2V6J5_COCH5|nr:uncharacterized protein COCC4DRAFT_123581 [Bipolaris maydis ATCC 48331]EMD95657.1 hypothetical protein COCHEDRAFT_1088323 [Bipolaris maydis C5]ENI10517.1 hypothetical protein COCC4DRAFT_123581 [Bipolaris maydis ATCC 48331]
MGTANVKRRMDIPQPASHNHPSALFADQSWMPDTLNAHAASRNMFPIAMRICIWTTTRSRRYRRLLRAPCSR